MEDNDTPVVEIDPNGDVVVLLNWKKLLVSSKILSMASRVFAAMFSSRFKEGLQNATPGIISTVSLPEDDAIAFEIICDVIHYRHKLIPTDPSLNQLVNIAIIADKYELYEALYAYSVVWLQSGIKNCNGKIHEVADWNKLLLAAYILDTPGEFARISWEIILNHVGQYRWLDVTDQVRITHTMIVEFDARSANLRTDLVNTVGTALYRPLENGRCTGSINAVSDYLYKLNEQELWPLTDAFKEKTLLGIYDRLICVEPQRKKCKGTSSDCSCSKTEFTFSGVLRAWKDTAFASQFGVCLDCVKTGRGSLRKKECRVEHS
ncbi:hypothetical protein MMC27_002245 [Xylographa pallens]|nr:hypothetical protein [Xylographa pallens]